MSNVHSRQPNKINVVPQSQWWLLLMVAFTSGLVGLDPDCQIHAVCVTCTLKSSVRLITGSLCLPHLTFPTNKYI